MCESLEVPVIPIVCSIIEAGEIATLAPSINPWLARTVPEIEDREVFSYSPTCTTTFLEEIPPFKSETTTLITNWPDREKLFKIVGLLRNSTSDSIASSVNHA